MNLEEGLKKGINIYANEYLKSILGMNIKGYTYELDFKDDTVLFIMPHDSHWDNYFSDIDEIRDFLNKSVTDNYRFGDFVKEAFLKVKNEKLYGADIYGKIQAEIIRAEENGVEPLLTSEDYKAIIDLIKEHRQLEKEMHVNKHSCDYDSNDNYESLKLNDKIIFHPGYYVEEYIKESNLTYRQFSNLAGINLNDLTEIINGNKDIDIFYAFRLAYATDTSRMFWLNLQDAYDKNIKSIAEKYTVRVVDEDLTKNIKEADYERNIMNKEEIRNKINCIVWSIKSEGAQNAAIMQLIEKVQEDAYEEGFKAAEEKFNTKNPSIGEVRITPDAINFFDLTEDDDIGEKTLYLFETDELTKAAGIYTDVWHGDTYQINFYGVETNDDFKVMIAATVYDIDDLKLRYPDVAGNILKISEAGEMEVAFNNKELEIIKAEFDKTVAEYKRRDNKVSREERIKKELEYIRNPNRYIDVVNTYTNKTIAYPLAEFLDMRASQSGFDDYEDMLNEGFSIDYRDGDFLKEPDKQYNNDDIELD